MTAYVTPEAADAIVDALGFTYRDRGLLVSSLGAPMPVFGHDVFPELHEKAAVLLRAINRNHPLLDGNKRLSWAIVSFFYAENGYDLYLEDADEGDRYIRLIAAGKMEDITEIAAWLEMHAQPL